MSTRARRSARTLIAAVLLVGTLVGLDSRVVSAQSSPAFVGLTPVRLLDTRDGTGGTTGPVGPNGEVSLQVTGVGGVPASNVGAVALNVTVTGPTASGWITVWPDGQTKPNASNLNFVAGQTIPNLVVVAVGANGRVRLSNSHGSTQLIADVAGYFPTGAGFNGLAPTRVLDTRLGTGAPAAPVSSGGSIDLQVTGTAGIPSSGVGAVILNVTVTSPTASGWITVWPTGQARPNASNLNFTPGETIPNLVVATVGAGGKISLFNSTGTTDLVADVAGWIPTGAGFNGLTPARVLDTRLGTGAAVGAVPAGSSVDVQVTGVGGVPASGVGAVVLNVTLTNPTASGWITAWPTGEAKPNASNLNFNPGRTVPNLVIAPVGAGGRVSLFNSHGSTDLIADVLAWIPGVTPAAAVLPRTDQTGVSTDFTCTVGSLGRVACWGNNLSGQLGIGTFSTKVGIKGGGNPNPTWVSGITGATSVATGDQFACAVVTGTVRCWGQGGNGQLGTGTSTISLTPLTVPGITNATEVAAGSGHACALLADGTIRCWGYNFYGQVGNGLSGSTYATAAPASVSGLFGATSIAAGYSHTCARLNDGTARCWGYGGDGQLGNGTTTNSATPVQVVGLTNAVSMSASYSASCTLTASGQVQCWGSQTTGDGSLSTRLQPVMVNGLISPTAVASGRYHNCAATLNGPVSCWGFGFRGQTGRNTISTGITAGAVVGGPVGNVQLSRGATSDHECAALPGAALQCWGDNDAGELGMAAVAGSSAVPVAIPAIAGAVGTASAYDRGCALFSGGAATCWAPSGPYAPTLTPGVPTTSGGPYTAGSVGWNHYCFLVGGEVRCLGSNINGSLGRGTLGGYYTAGAPVVGISDATQLATGWDFTCALRSTGTVQCWGYNGYGQLGDGTHTSSGTPLTVPGITTATSIATTMYGACAALADGTVRCWGYVWAANVAVPTAIGNVTNAVAVTAGDYHVCARTNIGTAMCWGYNADNQVQPASGTYSYTSAVEVAGASGITRLSAGSNHTCAIVAGGGVTCWGGDTSYAGGAVAAVSGISGALWLAGGYNNECVGLSNGQTRCWGRNLGTALGDGTGMYLTPQASVNAWTLAAAPSADVSASTMSGQPPIIVITEGEDRCGSASGDSEATGAPLGCPTPPRLV